MWVSEEKSMDADQKIQTFYKACSDMKSSKFILAETKISAILRSIVNSPELVSIVSDALAGFNFSTEFNKIQVKNELRRVNLVLPADQQKLVAIVFSLLSEIDAHRLDFHDFIYSYFDAGGSPLVECFGRFVSTIIIPFRNTLCELAGFEVPSTNEAEDDEEEKEDEEKPMEDEDYDEPLLPSFLNDEEEDEKQEDDMFDNNYDNDYEQDDENYEDNTSYERPNQNSQVEEFFDDVTIILNQIKDTVNNDNRIREDRLNELNITLDASLKAIEFKSLKIFNALMISLNNLLHNVRSTKFYNNELQNRIAEFYDEVL